MARTSHRVVCGSCRLLLSAQTRWRAGEVLLLLERRASADAPARTHVAGADPALRIAAYGHLRVPRERVVYQMSQL